MPSPCESAIDLTIIVPVYNLERFLEPLLLSLKNQKPCNYNTEIIFVLNNCTDKSEDRIRKSGLDCIIMYCTKQGTGPARNIALEVARGEYIWFIDGDDWLLSETAIKDVMDRMHADHLEIIRVPFTSNRFKKSYFSMAWQYVMRRDFIECFRFPDYQPGEDDAFMDSVLSKAGYNRTNYLEMPCMADPLYFYNYLREGSNMYRHIVLGESI